MRRRSFSYRLGNVVWWVSCLIAATCAGMMVVNIWRGLSVLNDDTFFVENGAFGYFQNGAIYEFDNPGMFVSPRVGSFAWTPHVFSRAQSLGFVLPLWIPLAVCAALAMAITHRRRVAIQRGCCKKCGYSLAGLAANAVCPECGYAESQP